MGYAVGKRAFAICDRCGWRYRYLQLQMEWTGFKVCPECYEVKNPQLDPPPLGPEAESLYQPRPEVPLPQAQLGVVTTEVPGPMTSTVNDPPSMIGHAFNGLVGQGAVGDLTVTTVQN